jgi:hypothetical protein
MFVCFWVGADSWLPLCTVNGQELSGRGQFSVRVRTNARAPQLLFKYAACT